MLAPHPQKKQDQKKNKNWEKTKKCLIHWIERIKVIKPIESYQSTYVFTHWIFRKNLIFPDDPVGETLVDWSDSVSFISIYICVCVCVCVTIALQKLKNDTEIIIWAMNFIIIIKLSY